MDQELDQLLRRAAFDWERASASGLTADMLTAASSWKSVVAHMTVDSLPATKRLTILRTTGTILATCGHLTEDPALMREALSYFERAQAATTASKHPEDLQNVVRALSRLHEMTGDIAWLRRSVEILSEAASAPGVGVAEARVILQDRLSVLEQIATLTGDEADVVTGIQAACDLLHSAYDDEPRATVRGGGARLPARRTN